jgi:hypothetical protein
MEEMDESWGDMYFDIQGRSLIPTCCSNNQKRVRLNSFTNSLRRSCNTKSHWWKCQIYVPSLICTYHLLAPRMPAKY